MPAPAPTQQTTARFGGLDGLRAVAVGLVLVYHLFPTLLPGGFLGVDVFFTISGFLITSLLLRELDGTGRIDLIGFWRRRARRLLPALALVLLVSASLARLVGGDLLVGLGKQIAGASFFVSNWVYISMGADYFTRDNPELFRNTWSLAIEEQFYIVLPLLLLVLFRARGRSTRAVVLLSLGVLSAVWMAGLALLGADATRVYFGSDTHTFGLLLGAGAAALLHRAAPVRPESAPIPAPGAPAAVAPAAVMPGMVMPGTVLSASAVSAQAPASPARRVGRVFAQLGWIAITLAGLAVLGWLAVVLPEGSSESFLGGFQLATAASLAVVVAISRPGSWAGRALDVLPLRWVGERSYGIYLWHWPLLLTFGAAFSSRLAPWAIGLLTLAATVAVAAASYTFVEQPIRRIGLWRACKRLFAVRSQVPRQRAIAISLAAVMLVTVPATAYAIASAPALSSAAEAIARGQAALDRQAASAEGEGSASGDDAAASSRDSSASSASDRDENAGGKSGGKSTDAKDGDAKDGAAKDSGTKDGGAKGKAKPAPPLAPEGPDITAVGDSVMLASLPELDDAFPGIAIDAAVSRGFGAGIGVLDDIAAQGGVRRVLVVGLGTNGPVTPEELTALRGTAGEHPIVLVNAYGERDWIPGVNQQLDDFAAAYRGVVVADWAGTVDGVDGALAGDGIHPNPSGGEIYAAAVQRALDDLQKPGEALGYALPRR